MFNGITKVVSKIKKMENETDYKQFVQKWITEIEKGNRFACKLITQWLDIDKDDDGIIYCDGTANGGIDLAYLEK